MYIHIIQSWFIQILKKTTFKFKIKLMDHFITISNLKKKLIYPLFLGSLIFINTQCNMYIDRITDLMLNTIK